MTAAERAGDRLAATGAGTKETADREDPSGVCVVLSTRDRPEPLRAAIVSIRAALRPSDELLVVDSASRDAEGVRRAAGDGTRVIRMEIPGLARARNAGWRSASRPIIAFTDDDCEVPSDWTELISAAFEDPAVGFVTGRVMGDREAALGVSTITERTARRFEGPQDPAFFGSGANMAFRRITLEGLAGFDESLGSGTRLQAAEDHDAFWRSLAAGWAGSYDPAISVTHRLWRGRFGSIRREFGYGVGTGAFAVKVVRLGDRQGWRFLWDRLWKRGLIAALRSLLKGHESATLAALSAALGAVFGAARAAFLRVEGGVFRPGRTEASTARDG